MLRKCLPVATFKSLWVKSGLRFCLRPLESSVRYFGILPNRTEPNNTEPKLRYSVNSVRFGRTLLVDLPFFNEFLIFLQKWSQATSGYFSLHAKQKSQNFSKLSSLLINTYCNLTKKVQKIDFTKNNVILEKIINSIAIWRKKYKNLIWREKKLLGKYKYLAILIGIGK